MDIQIVVPIYNAFEVTAQLLKTLIKYNSDDDVLLIDDASTDSRIKDLFQEIPPHWQTHCNPHNLGFVKTANIGLRASTGHSILLNSDTLVSNDWLNRFRQAIEHVSALGTATPWSNNAEICSLPMTLVNNPVPPELDELANQLRTHQPQYPVIPTAVGFCMLITAQAKQKVGYFDESTFGKGYGEENDYSLRVEHAGMKNIIVDNCFVAHIGNQSFQELSLRPNEETMQRLLAKHPEYLVKIQKFIEKDPLRQLRESIVAKISAF